MAFIPPPPPKLDALSRIPHPTPAKPTQPPTSAPESPNATHNAATSTTRKTSHTLPTTGRPRPLSHDCHDVPQDTRQLSSQGPAVTAEATAVTSNGAGKGTSHGADDGDRQRNQ
ncbi:hypothetical protein Skr01_54420 [Sphaerisporangium krabiense]|nr:hypothetical protein Skr01_54420 [Sphaerisporangium krabiense]